MEKGQSSLEYALILAGVLTVVGIAASVILGTINTGQTGTEGGFEGLNNAAIDQEVGVYGVKIISPTESEPVFVAPNGSFEVIMLFGSSVSTYDLVLINGTTYNCKSNAVVTEQKMTVTCPPGGQPLSLQFVGGVNSGDKITVTLSNNESAPNYREDTEEEAAVAT